MYLQKIYWFKEIVFVIPIGLYRASSDLQGQVIIRMVSVAFKWLQWPLNTASVASKWPQITSGVKGSSKWPELALNGFSGLKVAKLRLRKCLAKEYYDCQTNCKKYHLIICLT